MVFNLLRASVELPWWMGSELNQASILEILDKVDTPAAITISLFRAAADLNTT